MHLSSIQVTAPSVPLLVRATALSDTQIAVWWSPPLQNGGAVVTGYSVQWDVTASFGPTSYSAQVQQGATSLVLPNLVAGTAYTIRVAAYNAQGYGPFVAAQVTHTLQPSYTLLTLPRLRPRPLFATM